MRTSHPFGSPQPTEGSRTGTEDEEERKEGLSAKQAGFAPRPRSPPATRLTRRSTIRALLARLNCFSPAPRTGTRDCAPMALSGNPAPPPAAIAPATRPPKPPPVGPAPPAPAAAPPAPPAPAHPPAHRHGALPPTNGAHHHHPPAGGAKPKKKGEPSPVDPAAMYESLKNRIAALEEEEVHEEEEERRFGACALSFLPRLG